jgi:hypothetical protein
MRSSNRASRTISFPHKADDVRVPDFRRTSMYFTSDRNPCVVFYINKLSFVQIILESVERNIQESPIVIFLSSTTIRTIVFPISDVHRFRFPNAYQNQSDQLPFLLFFQTPQVTPSPGMCAVRGVFSRQLVLVPVRR